MFYANLVCHPFKIANPELNLGNLKEARIRVTRLLAKDPANAAAQDLLKVIGKTQE